MWYELKLKVTKPNDKGEDKEVSERFLADVELFAEAEQKGLMEYDGNCDVTDIKRSNIREFVNEKDETKDIFKATIIQIYLNDDGSEKKMKYYVAIWAKDVKEATELTIGYMKQGMDDMILESIARTSILDIL